MWRRFIPALLVVLQLCVYPTIDVRDAAAAPPQQSTGDPLTGAGGGMGVILPVEKEQIPQVESAAPEQVDVAVTTLATAKSLNQESFQPVLPTDLFTRSDYSVYAYVGFTTGASSANVQLRWVFTRPDGTTKEVVSPLWGFGGTGAAAAWLNIQDDNEPEGRWQVNYYARAATVDPWQPLGEQIFFVNAGLTCSEFLTNGDFESDTANWQLTSNMQVRTGKPHRGSKSAWFGGSNNQTYRLYQDVTLPAAAAGELQLRLYLNLYSQDAVFTRYDALQIQIRDASNQLLRTLDTIDNTDYYRRNPNDLWQPFTWDLTDFAGQQVRISVEANTDSSLQTIWYLDDVSVAKCQTTRAIGVRVILAEPSDATHQPAHNAAFYAELMHRVRQYHTENSYGAVQFNLLRVYDNDGTWYKLGRTHAEYATAPLEFVREAEHLALGTTAIPDDEIVVVVHAGASSQTQPEATRAAFIATQTWERPASPDGNEIIVAEEDLLGAWAHEIGHDLGTLLVGSVTPDLYQMGNVDQYDLMAGGAWNGGGANPPHMSSYTKEFLELLEYRPVDRGNAATYDLTVLPRQQIGDGVLQVVLERGTDGRPQKYYVVELRHQDSSLSQWDTSTPRSGVAIYYVDTKGLPKYGSYRNNIAQIINRVSVLDRPGAWAGTNEFFDAAHLLKFRFVDDETTGRTYRGRVEISTPAPDAVWLAGVVLEPSGTVATALLPDQPVSVPLRTFEPRPDVDLHAYTTDGRHVGMNYVTGEYEVQVPGVKTSGNLFNANEWILMPAGIEHQFVVRSVGTRQYLAANPAAQSHTDGVDTYSIYGLISQPGQGFVRSAALSGAIAADADLEHAVTLAADNSTLTLGSATTRQLPVDLTVGVSAPLLALPGEPFAYDFALGNNGGTAAGAVQLTVQLPAGLQVLQAPQFTTTDGVTYRHAAGTLAAASRATLRIEVQPAPGLVPGTALTLSATIGDDGAAGSDYVPSNNGVQAITHVTQMLYLPAIAALD